MQFSGRVLLLVPTQAGGNARPKLFCSSQFYCYACGFFSSVSLIEKLLVNGRVAERRLLQIEIQVAVLIESYLKQGVLLAGEFAGDGGGLIVSDGVGGDLDAQVMISRG